MGNAAGQGAHGFHFLGLLELLLETFLLRNIPENTLYSRTVQKNYQG
jgi:hypothetical protein